MAEQSGTATLIWEAKPGDMYGVEFLTDLIGETWRSTGNLVGDGNVMSWTDDGASTGSPPGNRLVRQRYYRIEALAGP